MHTRPLLVQRLLTAKRRGSVCTPLCGVLPPPRVPGTGLLGHLSTLPLSPLPCPAWLWCSGLAVVLWPRGWGLKLLCRPGQPRSSSCRLGPFPQAGPRRPCPSSPLWGPPRSQEELRKTGLLCGAAVCSPVSAPDKWRLRGPGSRRSRLFHAGEASGAGFRCSALGSCCGHGSPLSSLEPLPRPPGRSEPASAGGARGGACGPSPSPGPPVQGSMAPLGPGYSGRTCQGASQ